MDKKLIGVLGAASALAIVASAPATANVSASLVPAQSFAELLDPIPNAQETLASVDAAPVEAPHGAQLAQLHHHHHHHHHHHYRVYHHHHHHHHHVKIIEKHD